MARAALPPEGRFEGADDTTVDRVERLLGGFGPHALRGYAALLGALDHAARAHGGRSLSALAGDDAERLLASWSGAGVARRTLVLGATAPLKAAYFDDPAVYASFGCTWRHAAPAERPRWLRQVTPGAELDHDEEIECDAVVVGTGAGGAVVASELAARGHAVLLLEEGDYHLRDSFDGSAVDNLRRFYRGSGATGSVGNAVIPIPMGRLVGGSTAINTGTCWRTPEWVLDGWARERGLVELAPDRMAPYFDRVEAVLQVADADPRYLGGVATVVARGADALGWSHRPLRRNAPGCDGAGVCDFGCPTGARRSTEISYVPAALERGAQLFTGVRAERLLRDGARVVGVEGRAGATGRRVHVRARATVLACGTLLTPLLLQREGVHRGLRHVGRNLSIHPATTVSALFDEEIRGFAAIPQGYCVDQFHRDGILLMGASAPIDAGAAQFSFVGRPLMSLMDSYDRVASFGVMVTDGPHGRVRSGVGGRPLVGYWLGRAENDRLLRGTEAVARLFLAAGAREVYPALHGHRVLRGESDLRRLAAGRPRAADWLLTAFHPLGTCRMATSPAEGVVGPDHAVFGIPGLYVVDGSAVPGSAWVNPQVTIMALATRAADLLAGRLDEAAAVV